MKINVINMSSFNYSLKDKELKRRLILDFLVSWSNCNIIKGIYIFSFYFPQLVKIANFDKNNIISIGLLWTDITFIIYQS